MNGQAVDTRMFDAMGQIREVLPKAADEVKRYTEDLWKIIRDLRSKVPVQDDGDMLLSTTQDEILEAIDREIAQELYEPMAHDRIVLLRRMVGTCPSKKCTDQELAKEFWLRGYAEGVFETTGAATEIFDDGFEADWYGQYGEEFDEPGNFTGKFVEYT